MPKIPDLPGDVVPRGSEQEGWLRSQVAALCMLSHDRFPGSQPVSFGVKDLERLEKSDYWVCEKSDGVRILFVVLTNLDTNEQLVCIVDRHNSYRILPGMYFPHYENPSMPLRSTIIDAELVIDVDPQTRQETVRMLCFDCLVADNQNVMARTLDKRYYRLKEWFHKPFARMLRDHPHMASAQPFDIQVKEVNLSYHLDKVFAIDIPALQHGNDGLIYTPVATPYVPGTDKNMQWKPPSENSIDFKLVLRFPPLRQQPDQPDLHAKPVFALHVWLGGEGAKANYEPFDVMHVEDPEWESLKASGEQIDDRIVEVHWDPVGEHWRMMRFRDDKPHGNHRSVVDNIIQSIADGVEKDALLARSTAIKNSWKARHGQPAQAPPAAPTGLAAAPPPPYSNPNPYAPPPAAKPLPPSAAAVVHLGYGPMAPSPWSKVSGPTIVAGMKR
ncbi:mRNA capping enzyme [Auriscalpium vulgare]|uniref:mRNA capping enzyme n=1 Tax=Auriscalpium vulgare TaxID=40419 RepID=A0ACB8SBP5_9AGAM|nr:mRNA capping enzyme [Auriscalpium vulgare]